MFEIVIRLQMYKIMYRNVFKTEVLLLNFFFVLSISGHIRLRQHYLIDIHVLIYRVSSTIRHFYIYNTIYFPKYSRISE